MGAVLVAVLCLGPMSGKQISDLMTAITNGETYVNIHTEKHPNGEI
jgi:hypothetical protein